MLATQKIQHPHDRTAEGDSLRGVDHAVLFRRMAFIRLFEEKLLGLFEAGVLNGTTHACIGQEANCVGVISCLNPEDHVFSNHRCHGHYLAKTGDAKGLLLEIMGRPGGICGGIGGSQHLFTRTFKSNGILGGTAPGAVGIAMAMKLREQGRLSCLFLGDGAFGEGIVYESLNLASLWKLPLLVVVEDNKWSQSTPQCQNLAGGISARLRAFDIPTEELDTTDVLAIRDTAEGLVGRVRESGGPAALVLNTYRLCHHSKNDDDRPPDEVAAKWETEPLKSSSLDLDAATRSRILGEVDRELSQVIEEVRSME